MLNTLQTILNQVTQYNPNTPVCGGCGNKVTRMELDYNGFTKCCNEYPTTAGKLGVELKTQIQQQ